MAEFERSWRWQCGVHALGRLVDLRRALHVQGLLRTLVVEDLDELVEPNLLLQKIGSRGLGGFFFEGQNACAHGGSWDATAPRDVVGHPQPELNDHGLRALPLD